MPKNSMPKNLVPKNLVPKNQVSSPRRVFTPATVTASLAVLGGALLIGCGGGGTSGPGLTTGTGITTGTNTTGTATGTTTTTGTTTATTTGTTGTTGGPTTLGALPVNRILYSDGNGTTSVLRRIAADGTDSAPIAQFPTNVAVVAPNPQTSNVYAFAARPSNDNQGLFTLYRGTSTVDPATATAITTQQFTYVSDLAFSPDGTIVFFIAQVSDTDTPKLYRVATAGGAPQVLDFADNYLSVSPVGQKIVYSKLNASEDGTDLYVRDYSPTSTPTKLTNAVAENSLGSFDRTGTKIVYSSDAAASGYDLYSIPATGGTPTRLTNTPDLDEFGAAYNDDGTKIAYSALSQTAGLSGIYLANADGAAASQLLANTSLNFDIYWTSQLGRGITAGGPAGFVLRRPKLRHR